MFSTNGKLLKQIDSCPIDGLISVVSSDISMCKMEFDVVVPAKPLFSKRYTDYTYVHRKKNIRDMVFEDFNSYH